MLGRGRRGAGRQTLPVSDGEMMLQLEGRQQGAGLGKAIGKSFPAKQKGDHSLSVFCCSTGKFGIKLGSM